MESSKFTVGTKLGAYAKNIQKSRAYLSDVLSEIARDGMPPNGFFHDRPNGGLVVGAFSQSSSPTLKLTGISNVSITERPEPITMVTVISRADEPYLATHLFGIDYTQAQWTNAQYMFDGQIQDTTRYAEATTQQAVYLRIPTWMGPHINDPIDSVRIYGTQGVVAAYVLSDKSGLTADGLVPGFGSFMQMGTNEFIEIPGENITEAILNMVGKDSDNKLEWSRNLYLVLVFDIDDLPAGAGLNPRVLEIQVYSSIMAAWTAGLTPDTDTSRDRDWETR